MPLSTARATVPPSVPGDRTVRALVWRSGGVEDAVLDVPPLAPGEVLVRVRLATVCACVTRAVRSRELGSALAVLGHEGVGVVEAVGRGAEALTVAGDSVHPGMRIVWARAAGCGACETCRRGRQAACADATTLGARPMRGHGDLAGSLAERLVLAAGWPIAAVPASLPDAVVSPAGCATAVALAACDAAGDLHGRHVVVMGGGARGLAAVAAAGEQGARSCTVIDADPQRRRQALAFGADLALDAESRPPACDAVIDLSRTGDRVDVALAALRPGGTVVLGPEPERERAEIDLERLVAQGLRVAGVPGPEPHHLVAAVDLLAADHAMRPWSALVAPPQSLATLSVGMADWSAPPQRLSWAPDAP